jgi:hypothetical protein
MPTPQGKQVKKRPIPNLIPLQQTSPTPSESEMSAANFLAGGHSIFGGPSIIAQSDDEQQQEIAEFSGNGSTLMDSEGFEEEGESAQAELLSPQGNTSPARKIKKESDSSDYDTSGEKNDGSAEEPDLRCETCGHESDDVINAEAHRKTHKKEEAAQSSFLGMVGLSSTRCQHCR